MYLGLPLLAGLEKNEMAAVICHELGHHALGDSRLFALTYRSGDMLLATVRGGRLGWLTDDLFRAFAGMYMSVTFAVRRRQETGADLMAARVAGSEAMASALELAFPLYLASAGESALAEVAGLREFLSRTDVAEKIGALLDAQPAERRQLYDSHPPVAERVAVLRKAALQPGIGISAGSAIELLLAPEELACALADTRRVPGPA